MISCMLDCWNLNAGVVRDDSVTDYQVTVGDSVLYLDIRLIMCGSLKLVSTQTRGKEICNIT